MSVKVAVALSVSTETRPRVTQRAERILPGSGGGSKYKRDYSFGNQKNALKVCC